MNGSTVFSYKCFDFTNRSTLNSIYDYFLMSNGITSCEEHTQIIIPRDGVIQDMICIANIETPNTVIFTLRINSCDTNMCQKISFTDINTSKRIISPFNEIFNKSTVSVNRGDLLSVKMNIAKDAYVNVSVGSVSLIYNMCLSSKDEYILSDLRLDNRANLSAGDKYKSVIYQKRKRSKKNLCFCEEVNLKDKEIIVQIKEEIEYYHSSKKCGEADYNEYSVDFLSKF